ncbi:MAG: hypothetical protein J6C18_04990 [Bacteroidaceae bacterium]|nr:hypothetical protein [Bacteroidaceae bacterium]
MNTRNTLPLILVLMIALLTGCTNRAAMEELAYLETRMEANADSVRTALAAMNGNRLRGEARALHALLYSQALDKCYIDVTNDSLISIATKYYRKGDEPLRALQALYYHGRVMENAKEYHQAIALYTEAERYADEVEVPYIKGLLYGHLGALYSQDINYKNALDYNKKAYEYYEKAGLMRLQHIKLRDIGLIYLLMERVNDAEICLKKVLDWAYKNQDRKLCKTSTENLLYLYYVTEDTASTRKLYEGKEYELCKDVLEDDLYLVDYFAMKQDADRAKMHLEQTWLRANTISDTIKAYQVASHMHKRLGNYKEALDYHIELLRIQNEELRHTLEQPLLAAQRDFLQNQNELTEVKLQKSRQAIFFICVVAILAIAIIIIVSRTRARKKREELDGYVNLTEDLQRSLYSKEEAISRMGEQLQLQDEQARTMNTRLADLMRGRYELLNELTNTYYETSGSKADREAIYQKVKKAIDRMAGNRKEMQELESIVNEYCDNAMAHIHAELPELPYDDTVLLCYIYAGFSAKAIHLFTKNSISNIYSRKSRLREHIKQSDAPHRQQLLDMMP